MKTLIKKMRKGGSACGSVNKVWRLSRLAAGCALLGVSALAIADVSEDSKELDGKINVVVYGGTLGKFWTESLIKPFQEETGVKVGSVDSLTMQTLARLRATKDNPELSVVSFDPPGAFPAADQGLLKEIDQERVPNMADVYDWGQAKDGKLVAIFGDNACLAYNTNQIQDPPTSWEDMWNPDYAGKVVLPDISTSHGIMTIMIASKMNTPDEDLYNAEKGLEKLQTLRPNLLTYWSNHDQMASLLNSEQAWLGPWVVDRALTQKKRGAPIDCVVPEEGGIAFGSFAGIPANAENVDAAYAYLNAFISPEFQTQQAAEANLSPSNKHARIEEDDKPYIAPDRSSLIHPDWDIVNAKADEWTTLWNQQMQ